jgi:hypothetical protein
MRRSREAEISRRAGERNPAARVAGDALSPGIYALAALAFLGSALMVYAPALDGPFVSDDNHYVARNVWVHGLSFENAIEIFSPGGAATVAVVNYTPIHLLLHASSWELFGSEVRGHHVVNVLFHTLASLLFIPLLLRAGVPRAGAVLGAALFLLHPGNVEAVAWISQLKSSSAMVLSLAALLMLPLRPALGTLCFVLALLAKPTAAVVLPVALLLSWARREPLSRRWIVVCAIALAVYSAIEFGVHQRSGAAEATLYEAPLSLVATLMALIPRYLVMASTWLGVSAFHEPAPVASPIDPWWLASLPMLALLGWRTVHVLRRRQQEAAFWLWAVISYAPVSPLFPFLYQLADRYLYFMLPGLIGGVLLAGVDALQRIPEPRRRDAGRFAVALGFALAVLFGVRANGRAEIWSHPALLMSDAARNYPDGVSANLIRARAAARVGDVDATVTALRAAVDRGYNRYEQMLSDPAFASMRGQPRFQTVVREVAGGWIERGREKTDPTQGELRMIALAHSVRGEYDAAEGTLHRALDLGGRMDELVRADLEELSRQRHQPTRAVP